MLRIIIFCLAAILFGAACERDYDDRELMSNITIVMELPDGVECESAIPLESSFITEYNTLEKYAFGGFRGNKVSLTLRKGIYMLLLDVTLYFPDGTIRMARNADYTQPATAIKVLDDEQEIRLKMSYIR